MVIARLRDPVHAFLSGNVFLDGMIIIWAPTSAPQAAVFGSDVSAEEQQYEKEYWKARTPFRYAFRARIAAPPTN